MTTETTGGVTAPLAPAAPSTVPSAPQAPMVGGPGQPPQPVAPPPAAATAAQSAAAPAVPTPPAPTAAPATGERPAYVPEKYWSPEKGADFEALGKGYGELQSLLGKRVAELAPEQRELLTEQFGDQLKETMRAELRASMVEDPELAKAVLERNAPKAPEAYQVPPSLAEKGINLDFTHPAFVKVAEVGKAAGLSQEQMAPILEAGVELLAPYTMPLESKMAAVGPDYMQRATQAVTLARNLVERNVSDLGEREQVRGQVEKLMLEINSPEAFLGFERLLGTTREASLPLGGGGERTVYTEDSVRQMMRDPRYWAAGKRDPAFVAEIDKAWQLLKGGGTL